VPAARNRGEAHRSGCSSLGGPHDLKDRSAPPYDRLRLCRVGTDIMPSGEPRTDAEKPSNRVIPFWIIIVGSALIAGSLAALGGELTYQGLHKEPQYPDMVGPVKCLLHRPERFSLGACGLDAIRLPGRTHAPLSRRSFSLFSPLLFGSVSLLHPGGWTNTPRHDRYDGGSI
jgi:hypothetical protein